YYGVANWYHEFRQGHRVSVSGYRGSAKNERNWGGVSLGASYNWKDDKYSVYGEAGARTSFQSFGTSRIFDGEVGFRLSF
ncbi:MAG: autotransporter outer membrane beta-barrel domain-containing protein, partial [Planctomycetes bacterium]|nr:autotransporter outer membrane beta-barrel domain-containing protein [Planctomycetota bacterium]